MDGRSRLIHESPAVSRREFLRAVGVVGAGALLLGACGSDERTGSPTSAPGGGGDPPPETTTIRLGRAAHFASWTVPLYLAEQFLPAEGFTNVQYIDLPLEISDTQHLAAGEIDIGVPFASSVTVAADRGDPLVILAGVMNSPLVLFGGERVQTLRDLKGKRIWVEKRDDPTDVIYSEMAAMLAYVGIDIERDVEFVEVTIADIDARIRDGTIDVWFNTRPYSTVLRNAPIGHVIVDGAVDAPWSRYFGVMATANRDFVEKHPAATKRALRAILKAADMCAREPERAARYLVDRGLTPFTYDQTLGAITELTYAVWRDFNPEDTLRFYALRLKEAGLVKSDPDQLIARATDWRYLNEIKREFGVT